MIENSTASAAVPIDLINKILDLLQLAADRNAFPKIEEFEKIGQVYRLLKECPKINKKS